MSRNLYEIIFEDEDLVVVNKSPGLLTLPDRFVPEKTNLFHLLGMRYGRIFTVHRIDKDTSGVMVFARNEAAHRHLSEQFFSRRTEKIYLALIDGCLPRKEGVIDKPVAPHPHHPDRMVIFAKGKPSLTRYVVLETFKHHTLAEVRIETGRTHQIRVHFQSEGFPLAADPLYGRSSALFLSEIKLSKYRLGKDQEEKPLMARACLHAWRLAFVHPRTGVELSFEATLPRDFSATLKQLRKWSQCPA